MTMTWPNGSDPQQLAATRASGEQGFAQGRTSRRGTKDWGLGTHHCGCNRSLGGFARTIEERPGGCGGGGDAR